MLTGTRSVILNDTHAGARSDSDVLVEYQTRFYSEVLFPYMDQNEITHIIHLGDVFDRRKYVNFKSLAAYRDMFLLPALERGIDIDVVPGNHDVYYKNTNKLNSLDLLIGWYPNVTVHMNPVAISSSMALIPWITDDNFDQVINYIKTNPDNVSVLGGHFEISGFEMHRGALCQEGMPTEMFKGYMVLSGHFHTRSSSRNITYLGAQMEFTWADCEDPKFFHVFDHKTQELTPVRNPITLFTKLRYREGMEIDPEAIHKHYVRLIVTDHGDVSSTVDRIQQHSPYEITVVQDLSQFANSSQILDIETKSVVDSMSEYLEETIENKEVLPAVKSLMNELYVEAQNQ